MIKNILCIDDDTFIHCVIGKCFEHKSIIVKNSLNAQEALKVLEDFSADLILLDYMMPDCDGPATLKLLREHSINTPVIFLTASTEDESELIKSGAIGVLKKPINPKKLLNQINVIMKI